MNVSVVIPVYNAASFISEAVKSALAQSEVKQIILVEDGSSDNSLEVCRALSAESSIVELYRHPHGTNCGEGASRNLGIEKARHTYITFLDADDFMLPGRFEAERAVFERYPDADGVYSSVVNFFHDSTGEDAWFKRGFKGASLTGLSEPADPESLFNILTGYQPDQTLKGHLIPDCLTIKRESLKSSRISFPEELRLHTDTLFIYQCAYYLKLYAGALDRGIVMRRIHSNNAFIHESDIQSTRSLFYLATIRWAVKKKLPRRYIFHFRRRYCSLRPENCQMFVRVLLHLRSYCADPQYRRATKASARNRTILKKGVFSFPIFDEAFALLNLRFKK
ncbi:MAG: glycosyltransferase family 2 protein [Saprospiraceae bacterium]|jgi:glycosyltransferase involved in cell wall biosynthesis|nr:glycosyltransferase family 2 protein [Saprospiraceae bacterium]